MRRGALISHESQEIRKLPLYSCPEATLILSGLNSEEDDIPRVEDYVKDTPYEDVVEIKSMIIVAN